ncbi:MAG TPA: type II toxin-antitoxin system VapC family toxin [Acidiferrobacteraceae bacterium]|nr:type II toxin-antitoxin system VapC family toxin [Acidiferrobacteraceae bacterium]
MIGLDTNVLVRYAAQDDPKQTPKARRLLESLTPSDRGYVSLVTIVELYWVMTSCYAATKGEICNLLETLLRTKEITVAHADVVWKSVRQFRDGGVDLADCLIARDAEDAGCSYTSTFDRNAAKYCGMQLIE